LNNQKSADMNFSLRAPRQKIIPRKENSVSPPVQLSEGVGDMRSRR